jgi:hypothetical protein
MKHPVLHGMLHRMGNRVAEVEDLPQSTLPGVLRDYGGLDPDAVGDEPRQRGHQRAVCRDARQGRNHLAEDPGVGHDAMLQHLRQAAPEDRGREGGQGFGGHEARSLMQDWGWVAFSGHYRHLGLPLAPAPRSRVASLYIQMEGDQFAPPASTLGLAELIQAQPHIEQLASPRPPQENPHSAWLKAPQSVVDCVDGWLRRLQGVSAGSAEAG